MNASPTQDQSPIPNPYRGHAAPVVTGTQPKTSPLEDGTTGLDGDLIDSMLRTRQTEGRREGRNEALREAQQRFAEVYDQGYIAGFNEGTQARQGEVVRVLGPNLTSALESLKVIHAATGSTSVRDRAEHIAVQVGNIARSFGIDLPLDLMVGAPQVVKLAD